jgi:hypothetical protein
MNERLQAALEYHRTGFSVVPVHWVTRQGRCSCGNIKCANPGKHPSIRWTPYKTQRADQNQIRAWWKRWPQANVGIVTGKISNLVVVDVDGPEGEESLKRAGIDLPTTPTVLTGGGGRHLYYRYSEQAKTGTGVLPRVDVRADGGFVVAPPSGHKSGNVYRWAEGLSLDDVEMAEFPEGLLKPTPTSGKSGSEKQGKVDWSDMMKESEPSRNVMLTQRAGSLLGRGLSRKDTLEILLALNEARCNPPLPEDEVRRIVNSIADREGRRQGLDQVNTLLGMPTPITGVRKRVSGSDEGMWDLVLEDGRVIEIGPTSKLLQFAHVRARIADTVGHLIDVKRNRFNDVTQAILNAAEEVFDTGRRDEMVEWVKGLLSLVHTRMRPLAFDARKPEQKFDMITCAINVNGVALDVEGRIYIRLSAYTMRMIRNLTPWFDSTRAVADRLRADLGFEGKELDITYEGRRARVRVQVSPPGLADELDIDYRPVEDEDLREEGRVGREAAGKIIDLPLDRR